MKALITISTLLFLLVFSQISRGATFVLVHGGYGGSWTFKAVAELLLAQGHEVYRPSLTGLGERVHLARADTGLETHILDVVNLIRFEQLQDIVLVGHSYGGMVITGVADRLPERIKRLVYVEGMLPGNGQSVLDIYAPAAKHFERYRRGNLIYHPRYQADAPYPKPVPQPAGTISEKIVLTGAGAKLPSRYIFTVSPGTHAKDDPFYPQAERARTLCWPVIELSGSHNIQRDDPAALVAELLRP